ncbi:bifunctional hydroxymethylpyrimidine kinase/phosphomethylpyrimidine kinase [Novipirellula sp. SH528]|uniref:bifunctional hydroxymethylpyrimidine kinase/phosphomethylpyrimidine kinase n=1 Tax=Novipirellula sp. SH528 TaxID=3454466 RepID=UPI003FA07243
MHVALTIAGSDPSGGAGLQADLKTFHANRVYGTSVVTLLTVQNTQTVDAIEMIKPDFVLAQLDAVLDDIPPTAAKTGALGNAAMIEAIAERAASFQFPLVVDPVMISKHRVPLLDDDAVDVLGRLLLPHAFLVTPNMMEAARLANITVENIESMEAACKILQAMGAKNVLLKGGEIGKESVDLLYTDDRFHRIGGERIPTQNTHGSGCVLSAAITASLAKNKPLIDAVEHAKRFIIEAIRTAPKLGKGLGPLNLML